MMLSPGEAPLIDNLPPDCAILARVDCDRTEDAPLHRHPHGEFYLIRQGHAVSASTKAQWLIPSGQAYWVPPGVIHGGAMKRVSGICAYLSPTFITGQLPDEPAVFSVSPLIASLLERWVGHAAQGASARSIDHHIVALLADEMSRALTKPILLPMPSTDRMRHVMSAWSALCDERVDLTELAFRCGMSRRTFTRKFREETGMSAGKWIETARVIRGCRLMAEGISVTETAFMLGYESVASFFNLCRRNTGMSPSVLAHEL